MGRKMYRNSDHLTITIFLVETRINRKNFVLHLKNKSTEVVSCK